MRPAGAALIHVERRIGGQTDIRTGTMRFSRLSIRAHKEIILATEDNFRRFRKIFEKQLLPSSHLSLRQYVYSGFTSRFS